MKDKKSIKRYSRNLHKILNLLGSKSLCNKFNLSSATIRNDMAELRRFRIY